MIQKVEFRNFKGLRHLSLDLERLTVLVGPNASGKTSILKGLLYLSGLGTSEPEKLFSEVEDPALLLSRNAAEPLELLMVNDGRGMKLRFLPPDSVRQNVTFAVSKGDKAFWHVEAFANKNALETNGLESDQNWKLLTKDEFKNQKNHSPCC
jgi:ABC-type uncharacterized transport system ATPase subunit